MDADAMLDTLIVGGGLSGLALARLLHQQGRSFQLLEARERLGGRILTQSVRTGETSATFDLGPAWFWPGQDRIERLANDFGLGVFEQYASGMLVYEDELGRVQVGQGYASMQGSLRMRGGLSALIAALVSTIPDPSVRLAHRALALLPVGDGMLTRADVLENGQKVEIRSRRVVLATPPRLAAASVDLSAALSSPQIALMASIPTWMAGQAKIVAVYERPFWREAGLSGDAMSRSGPLMEIHDASPYEGGPFALFGFVGVPAASRIDAAVLRHAGQQQLVRLFGPQANHPISLFLKDWAQDEFTAVPEDRALPNHHPRYGLPEALASLCNGRILLGSTETASQFGGYLEGALEAAERCAGEILR